MKIAYESIFSSSIRSFFSALFAMLGILVGLIVIGLVFYAVASNEKDDGYKTSDVKILANDKGSRKYLGKSAPVILQISLNGEIGSDNLTASKMRSLLWDSREGDFEDDRVKAILLVINSPGGGVNDSDSIYRMLVEYKKRYSLPIYAFVDGICASGGYYIACAADKIYTSEISIVGSVGVLAWPPFFNITDVMKKIGVESLTLYAGKGKDEMNPLRPWKEGEQDNYQKLLSFYYGKFLEVVSSNRPLLNQEALKEEYGAQVFPAPEAHRIGYTDGFNYQRSEVLKELAKTVGIEEEYQVVSFDSKSWLKKLFETNASEFSVVHKHQFFNEAQSANPFAYIYK